MSKRGLLNAIAFTVELGAGNRIKKYVNIHHPSENQAKFTCYFKNCIAWQQMIYAEDIHPSLLHRIPSNTLSL